MADHYVGVRVLGANPRPAVIINPKDEHASDIPYASYETACRQGLSLAVGEGWKLQDETGVRLFIDEMLATSEEWMPQTREQWVELAADLARVIADNEAVLPERDLAILEAAGALIFNRSAV